MNSETNHPALTNNGLRGTLWLVLLGMGLLSLGALQFPALPTFRTYN